MSFVLDYMVQQSAKACLTLQIHVCRPLKQARVFQGTLGDNQSQATGSCEAATCLTYSRWQTKYSIWGPRQAQTTHSRHSNSPSEKFCWVICEVCCQRTKTNEDVQCGLLYYRAMRKKGLLMFYCVRKMQPPWITLISELKFEIRGFLRLLNLGQRL